MTTRRNAAPLVWRLIRRGHGRLVRGGDAEGGFAMIFALLLIFIIASLSIAVVGIVYNQVAPTQTQRKSIATVNAANAGLQVSLNQIRAASAVTPGGTLLGVLSQLRCTGSSGATFTSDTPSVATGKKYVTAAGATFSGYVNGKSATVNAGSPASSGNLQFQTSISYYSSDPSSKPLDWLASNALRCPLTVTPGYAYLQTHGVVDGQTSISGDRTQHATYTFATTNTNVQGGRLIPLGDTNNLCITAPAAIAPASAPPVGSMLTMQPCLAFGTPTQLWSYRADLTLFYDGAPTANLCIQAPTSTGQNVTLQTCAASTAAGGGAVQTYPYLSATLQSQEWPFDDNGHFATAATGGGVGGNCLDPAGQTSTNEAPAGTALQLVACDGITAGLNAWNPDPQVGAGKAGGNTTGVPSAPTNQYVNYAEFGRCLDITGQDVTANHLIDYPCKQAPDTTQLTFNQVWTYNAKSGGYGTVSVTKGGTQYCLTAPASASGYYIVVSPTGNGSASCATSPTPSQLWQPTGQLVGNYAQSYELVNQALGMCMSASTAPSGDLTPGSSNIIVETCNGTPRQKWNAPPNPPGTGLGNISQDPGDANTLPSPPPS